VRCCAFNHGGIVQNETQGIDMIGSQIDSCHRQIDNQTSRLMKQMETGRATHESRFVLLCLHRSLQALTRCEAAMRMK
jgi:hypothetical protein